MAAFARGPAVAYLPALLVLCGCAADKNAPQRFDQKAPAPCRASFGVHLASDSMAPGYGVFDWHDDWKIYVDPEPVITQRDIETIEVSESKDRPAVLFGLNDRGAALMKEVTTAHMGGYLSLFVDGELITTAKINSVVSNHVMLTGSFSRAWAEDVVRRLQPQ